MFTSRERLYKIISEIPESELEKMLDFAEGLKESRYNSSYGNLTKTSESSLDFWDHAVDDEIWNLM